MNEDKIIKKVLREIAKRANKCGIKSSLITDDLGALLDITFNDSRGIIISIQGGVLVRFGAQCNIRVSLADPHFFTKVIDMLTTCQKTRICCDCKFL